MNWKKKMAYVVESVLNDDSDNIMYELEFLSDDAFRVSKWGEPILTTEVLPADLASHWRHHAKNTIYMIMEEKVEKYLQDMQSIK